MAGDGIFLFDEQGAIHFANRFAERMLGIQKTGCAGKACGKYSMCRIAGLYRTICASCHAPNSLAWPALPTGATASH